MITHTITCDICESTIENKPNTIDISRGWLVKDGQRLIPDSHRTYEDVCDSCVEKIYGFIDKIKEKKE